MRRLITFITRVLPKNLMTFLPTAIVVVAAGVSAFYVYVRYESEPWTRFGQIRAYVIEVAPRISGRIDLLPVHDNQHVAAGDLLFRITPEPYELSVRQAERSLELARQEVAQLEAAILAANAMVEKNRAAVASAKANIVQAETGVVAADASINEAQASVVSARAAVVRQQAALHLAGLELTRSERLRDQQAGSVQTAQIKAASVKENEAAVVSANAGVDQSNASLEKARAARLQAEAKLLIAQQGLTEAEAALRAAEAKVAEASAQLGQPGDENVRVRQAQVSLEQAKLNLSFTSVYAPSNGYVTNLQVNVGSFANAGQPQFAFVNSDSYWVYAFFRETQLSQIHVGDSSTITLMSRPDRPLLGKVESINQAIYPPGIATSEKLVPQIEPTFNWVRLAQRVPVRVHFTEVPEDVHLIVGTTVSVAVHPTQKVDR